MGEAAPDAVPGKGGEVELNLGGGAGKKAILSAINHKTFCSNRNVWNRSPIQKILV